MPLLHQQKKPKKTDEETKKIAQRNHAPAPGPPLPTAPSRDNRIIFQLRPPCIKDRHPPKHIPIFHVHRRAKITPKHHHVTATSNLRVDFATKIPASDRTAVGPTNFYTVLKNLLTLTPMPTPMPPSAWPLQWQLGSDRAVNGPVQAG